MTELFVWIPCNHDCSKREQILHAFLVHLRNDRDLSDPFFELGKSFRFLKHPSICVVSTDKIFYCFKTHQQQTLRSNLICTVINHFLGYVHQKFPGLVDSYPIAARLLANFGKYFEALMQPNALLGFRAKQVQNAFLNTSFFAKEISKVTKSVNDLEDF